MQRLNTARQNEQTIILITGSPLSVCLNARSDRPVREVVEIDDRPKNNNKKNARKQEMPLNIFYLARQFCVQLGVNASCVSQGFFHFRYSLICVTQSCSLVWQ